MIRNYFKTAFRTLWNNKSFTAVNISGLSIGLSAAFVIFLIVQYDFSFDRFEKNRERIYRVVSNFSSAGNELHNSGVSYPLHKVLPKEITGLELCAPFSIWGDEAKITIAGNNNRQASIFKNQKNIIFADENYVKILSYQWVAGSTTSAFLKPNQAVLTESTAQKYFAGLVPADIIGKEIILNDSVRLTVSGILQDLKKPTDFPFTMFLSLITLDKTGLKPGSWNDWKTTGSESQLLIKILPQIVPARVEKNINELLVKYNSTADSRTIRTFTLQPLSDLHFEAEYGTYTERVAHIPTLTGLCIVAVFLLLLGCINFINLTTAKASQRAKEIGIRKVMGSSRKQLVLQFLSETFLVTLIASLLSIVMTPLLLNVFKDLLPEGFRYDIWPDMFYFFALIIVVVSLAAGFYPALILSSYKPVSVLKKAVFGNKGENRTVWLRKTLTVAQFAIAQFFIIATLIVGKQVQFSVNHAMGFKKNAILYFSTGSYDTVRGHRTVLMNKLKSMPEIAMVSLSNKTPVAEGAWTVRMKYNDGKKDLNITTDAKMADTGFLRLYQLTLLVGQNLPSSDTVSSILVNEAFTKLIGCSHYQEAIGKTLEWKNKNVQIAGVIADFHQKSLHSPIVPLMIASNSKLQTTFNLALQPQNVEGSSWNTTIAKIEHAWKEVYPDYDFTYHFLDETIRKYYTAEQNIAKLLSWATGLTIFISCLGLLGLATHITYQRRKEIGIRKVVGASVLQLVTLLSKDFIKLVSLACLIAIPIAWWASHQWLQNFAYKTTITIGIFIVSGLIMTILALFVLCSKTIRAAYANPIKSLRTE